MKFINRLDKKLSGNDNLPDHHLFLQGDTVCLAMPMQEDSDYVINVSAQVVDDGFGLLIELDLAEIIIVLDETNYYLLNQARIFKVIYSPYQYKSLKNVCRLIQRQLTLYVQSVADLSLRRA
ncbi:MAG: hypothetical protein WCK87_01815 [Candidatus Saccharibacteria bacterium]